MRLAGPSYLGFAFNATEMPSEDYYDYIIVGGGTAACPLAATLSENQKVLLLERGGVPYAYGKPNLMTQEGFIATLMEVDTYDSPAQAFTSEDGVPNETLEAGFLEAAAQSMPVFTAEPIKTFIGN